MLTTIYFLFRRRRKRLDMLPGVFRSNIKHEFKFHHVQKANIPGSMSTDEVPVDVTGGKPIYRFRKRDKFRFYANKLIRQVCVKN